jgi:adenylate cyclase
VVQRDYYLFGDYDKGLQELERILEIFPNDNFALWVLGTVQTQKGNYPEAINAFLKRSIPSKHTNWALGYAYAKAGKTKEAKEILSFLLEKEKQTYIMPTFIACIYLGLGEKEKGIEYLQKASQLNDYWTVFYGLDPWLDPVRKDPRFIQILRKAKLN